MNPPIFIYYEITDFHQNYRRFAYSKSNKQLEGFYSNSSADVKTCFPVLTESDRRNDETNNGTITHPCGLLPKYYFNDSFSLYLLKNNKPEKIEIKQDNLVFDSEKGRYKNAKESWTNIESESFNSWMKISPTTPICKLYGRIDEPLEGDILISVQNNYGPVIDNIKGSRSIILATMSPFGGSQKFLGSVFLVVGVLFLLYAFAFWVCLNPAELQNSREDHYNAHKESI